MEERKILVIVTESDLPLYIRYPNEEGARKSIETLEKMLLSKIQSIVTFSDDSKACIKVVLSKIQYFYLEY